MMIDLCRYIYQAVRRYEAWRNERNSNTDGFITHLLVRDFFQNLARKYGNKIFYLGGCCDIYHFKPYHRISEYSYNDTKESTLVWRDMRESITLGLIHRWKYGLTGIPIIDANMRELYQTGWMSNRGRQIVASYLIWDLHIDWRIGAQHFEHHLIDYDVASNYCNWNSIAGLTGGRINRFHVIKQSRDYDPDAQYIRYWIPQLTKIPLSDSRIHHPWTLSEHDQMQYNLILDRDYPRPSTEVELPTLYADDSFKPTHRKKNDNIGSIKPKPLAP